MTQPMSARALAIFQRTYSRPLEGGGHETFEQTIDRVIQHQRWLWHRVVGEEAGVQFDSHYPYGSQMTRGGELEALRVLMLDRKVLPSGRTMWLGGTEIARTRE